MTNILRQDAHYLPLVLHEEVKLEDDVHHVELALLTVVLHDRSCGPGGLQE